MGLLDNLKDKVDDVLEKTDIDDKLKAKADEVFGEKDVVEKAEEIVEEKVEEPKE